MKKTMRLKTALKNHNHDDLKPGYSGEYCPTKIGVIVYSVNGGLEGISDQIEIDKESLEITMPDYNYSFELNDKCVFDEYSSEIEIATLLMTNSVSYPINVKLKFFEFKFLPWIDDRCC